MLVFRHLRSPNTASGDIGSVSLGDSHKVFVTCLVRLCIGGSDACLDCEVFALVACQLSRHSCYVQAGDAVTFSLLKRPRRGIIPCEVAGITAEEKQVADAYGKVRRFLVICTTTSVRWHELLCVAELILHGDTCL